MRLYEFGFYWQFLSETKFINFGWGEFFLVEIIVFCFFIYGRELTSKKLKIKL